MARETDNHADTRQEQQHDFMKDKEDYTQFFINEQSDFFLYMTDKQLFKSRKTYHDYLSRLRYVAQFYKLDKTLTPDRIRDILSGLKSTSSQRNKYNTPKGISDIASGLKRFLEYIESDYRKKIDQTVLSEEQKIVSDTSIPITEREAIVKSRIGQGQFRNDLINFWQGCSVTNCKNLPLLVASHIRPWRKCDNVQRLDVYNGLLLTPNLDKLFDRGYISFDDKGRIISSESLPLSDMKTLGVDRTMKLARIESQHKPYLDFHRNNCLL